MSEPAKTPKFSEFLKALAPSLIAMLTKIILENVGGFQLFIMKIVLKYGGRAAIIAINKAIDDHDRAVAQAAVTADYNKVVADPNATQEERKDAAGNFLNG